MLDSKQKPLGGAGVCGEDASTVVNQGLIKQGDPVLKNSSVIDKNLFEGASPMDGKPIADKLTERLRANVNLPGDGDKGGGLGGMLSNPKTFEALPLDKVNFSAAPGDLSKENSLGISPGRGLSSSSY